MTLSVSEKEELESLRQSARLWITDPLERAFFELDSILENPMPNRLDSVMPTNSFYVLARALKELKRAIEK
jgi:hypothetical protein